MDGETRTKHTDDDALSLALLEEKDRRTQNEERRTTQNEEQRRTSKNEEQRRTNEQNILFTFRKEKKDVYHTQRNLILFTFRKQKNDYPKKPPREGVVIICYQL